MTKRKVGIIGAGAVGATAAYSLSMMGTCGEIVLFDIAEGVAKGKAIDIGQSTHYAPNSTIITAAETPADVSECDIVVITAGVPRKGDMTREDLLMINAKIMKSVVEDVTYVIKQMTGWERNRIIGLSGALEGARMAYQIYKKLGFGAGQIGTLVIGDHGQNMIPLPQEVQVGSVDVAELLSKEEMEEIIERTKHGGAEIVKHLGTSGYYAPGRAIAYMVEAILNDSKVVVACSALLEGEYGYSDVAVGVPVVLGKNGMEQIIEIALDDETKAKFKASVESIQSGIEVLRDNQFFN